MNNSVALYNNFPAIKNYETYKSYVLNIPNLSEKEERTLLEKFQMGDCIQSAQQLILSQLKTVVRIAHQFKNYGMPEEDLVQEGNIGLMKAVKNFNVDHKVRLYTYALLWIKSEMQSYILKNWKIIKVGTTKNLKKLFFNFRQIQKEMIDLGIPKSQLKEIVGKKLNVSEDEITEVENYFALADTSIDTEDEDSPIYYLTDEQTPETNYMLEHDGKLREEILNNVVSQLTHKQQEVIKMRFFEEEKKTHKEIAKIIGVSSERVRQIEVESMEKMKKLLINQFGVREIF